MTVTLDINELEEIGLGKKFQSVLCVMLESSYLFKEVERDSNLIIITEGKAQILKDDGYGEVKKIADVRKGVTLGEMSVIDNFSHSATVVTSEDSEIALTTKTKLKNITEKYPAIGVKLLWQIAWQLIARVRQASGQLVDHIN